MKRIIGIATAVAIELALLGWLLKLMADAYKVMITSAELVNFFIGAGLYLAFVLTAFTLANLLLFRKPKSERQP